MGVEGGAMAKQFGTHGIGVDCVCCLRTSIEPGCAIWSTHVVPPRFVLLTESPTR